MMKKILIIGASVLQLPAIKKAKELGYYVGVLDYNPKAVGVPLADEFYCVSTIDVQGVVNVAESFRPNGIMTLATDMPMRSIAAACDHLSLPGITMDTALKATDKGEMIKAFQAHDVARPWFYVVEKPSDLEKVVDQITYPCISKPTDNSGSRGVMLAENESELKEAVEYSSSQGRRGGVIVEEYLRGQEVSVEIMVVNGVVHVLQITDKLTTGAPHFVEMGHSQPSRLEEKVLQNVREVAVSAVKAVGIDNGPAHVEIMVTDNGAKMIELGARMGGDCITTHLVPLSTGIDMVKATMDVCCGEEPDVEIKLQKGSAIRFIDAPKGVIKDVEGAEDARAVDGVKELSFTKWIGDTVGEIGSSVDRMGFVIAQADTPEEAVEICKKAISKIKIMVD